MRRTSDEDECRYCLDQPIVRCVSGLTPMQIRSMIAAAGIKPVVLQIKAGRGHCHRFSHQQCFAISYGAALLRAKCAHDWAYGASAFVATQTLDQLLLEFAKGKTVVVPGADGQYRLSQVIVPADDPSKAWWDSVSLKECVYRTHRKMLRLYDPHDAEELSRLWQKCLEEAQAAALRVNQPMQFA